MTSTPLVEENNISQELEVPDIQDMKTIRIHFNSALNSTRKGLPISANYALVHVSKSISLHQCGFRIINHRLHNIDSTVLCRGVLIKKGFVFKNGGRKITAALFGMTQIKSHTLSFLNKVVVVFVLRKQEVSRHGGKASDRRHNGAGRAAPRHQDRGSGEAAECTSAGSGLYPRQLGLR